MGRGATAHSWPSPMDELGMVAGSRIIVAMSSPSHVVRRVATHLLLWYARHLPYHRGKTRLSRHLRRVFGVHVEGEAVERRDGLWWSLDRGDYMSQDLYWSGANDRAELRHALRVLPRDGVMFDVGANFGSYCVTMAARLQQQCVIHAFEPHPIVFSRLQKNIALNHATAVTAHREGLSDREETAALVEEKGHSGATYLRSGRDVFVTTIDAFCDRAAIARLDLLKIDAEGAELRILRGAVTALARFKPAILLELNAAALQREDVACADVLAWLQANAYRVFAIDGFREIADAAAPLPSAVFNVLCLARDRAGNLP